MSITIARGLHYQNPLVYKFFTALKLRQHHQLRYKIAAESVRPGESVLDICAGTGELKDFLPASCYYQAVDASPAFGRELSRKKIPHSRINLHEKTDLKMPPADVLTMIISLCQFRDTTADYWLESFKAMAGRVVIVEDVLPLDQRTPAFIATARDYLCATDYYLPMRLFSVDEFRALMSRHGYDCRQTNDRYWVGHYEKGSMRS